MQSRPPRLSKVDRAVLEALVDRAGTVVSRTAIQRLARIMDFSDRRCDASVSAIRKILGPDSIITVRRRGWMISPESLDSARKLLAHKPGNGSA